jgi:hypothetical protein
MQWYGGRIDYRIFYRRTPGALFLRPSPPDPPHIKKSIKELKIDWDEFFKKPHLFPPQNEHRYETPDWNDFTPVGPVPTLSGDVV